jgi:hypothetical protein
MYLDKLCSNKSITKVKPFKLTDNHSPKKMAIINQNKKIAGNICYFHFFYIFAKTKSKKNEFSINKYILVVALSTQKVVSQIGVYL